MNPERFGYDSRLEASATEDIDELGHRPIQHLPVDDLLQEVLLPIGVNVAGEKGPTRQQTLANLLENRNCDRVDQIVSPPHHLDDVRAKVADQRRKVTQVAFSGFENVCDSVVIGELARVAQGLSKRLSHQYSWRKTRALAASHIPRYPGQQTKSLDRSERAAREFQKPHA